MKIRILLLVLLSACGLAQRSDGGSGTTLDEVPGPDCASYTCLTPYAKQHLYYEVNTMTPAMGESLAASGLPSWASFDAATGIISGYPATPGSNPGIMITKTVAGIDTEYGPYNIFVEGDPLVQHAWFIKNTGQKTFAQYGGLVGEDLNLIDTWRLQDGSLENITGHNIKVAVSDTGLEIAHQDLTDNMRNGSNRKYRTSSVDYGGDPTSSGYKGDHGTSVAGLIGAVGWNGVGTRGIAPNVLLSGLNFLSSTQTNAFLVDQASGDFDIFNQSWGVEEDYFIPLPSSYINQIVSAVTTGRNNKGQIFLRAAGNSFFQHVSSSGTVYWSRPSNASADNALPYVIVVGATNADGRRASYSSTGPNVWVSAPGGEFGVQDPAMITVDQSGCSKGYSRTGITTNAFEYGHSQNPSCNYTSRFNGTSSATPVTSGVVALMLQANPDLTWRDVKHILAATAEKVDASWPNGQSSIYRYRSWDPDFPTYEYEQPWITNHAGFDFHSWYGFGRIDAKAAVDMAVGYVSGWNAFESFAADSADANQANTTNLALPIPDDSATGVTSDLTVDADAGGGSGLIIEAITVRVATDHPYKGDLAFELQGPTSAGTRTKSILFNINNSFEDDDWSWNQGVTFLTNAYYGETSDGTWTLKVLDGSGGDGGSLNRWKITIYGRDP
jgi:subtilisin-like proprotein convertase family protein